MAVHEGQEAATIRGCQAHVFVQVEAAPAEQQRLLLFRHQGLPALHESGIDRLHRAAGRQPQRPGGARVLL